MENEKIMFVLETNTNRNIKLNSDIFLKIVLNVVYAQDTTHHLPSCIVYHLLSIT